jgi:hypothetical protein
MQPCDRAEFVAVLNALALVKPGANKLTPEAIDLWWNAMSGWPLQSFKAAASHLSRTHEFMPSPFHFEQLRTAGQPTAAEAWVIAMANLTSWRTGSSTAGAFIDHVVKLVGGYHALAMATEKDLPFIERRFKEYYDDSRDKEAVRLALPQVANSRSLRISGPMQVVSDLRIEQKDAAQ